MQEYLKLLEKYECKLIDGKIINKHGKDTNINWSSIPFLAFFSLSEENKNDGIEIIEGQLKITHDRR